MENNLEMFAQAQKDGSMKLQVQMGKLILPAHVCKPGLQKLGVVFKFPVSNGLLF